MKLLFLTNLRNGDPEEDQYLIGLLEKFFEIVVSHTLDCKQHLSFVQGVIIRNIWPTHEYQAEWELLKRQITALGILTYNPLVGKGDNGGKSYLLTLYQKGFPVIPSVDTVEDLAMLPESTLYWIKPKQGCDGSGARTENKTELLRSAPQNCIIQPYVEFVSEPSFFFIDNVFAYAITTSNRLTDQNVHPYKPTSEDLEFAQKFVDWNALPCGIQRVDAVRTKDGKLLLTEVEDIAGYLYLLDLEDEERNRVAMLLVDSIGKFFANH
ncbi:MAG: hypothetical protein AAB447_03335 [Patescibacteria group bacterium]